MHTLLPGSSAKTRDPSFPHVWRCLDLRKKTPQASRSSRLVYRVKVPRHFWHLEQQARDDQSNLLLSSDFCCRLCFNTSSRRSTKLLFDLSLFYTSLEQTDKEMLRFLPDEETYLCSSYRLMLTENQPVSWAEVSLTHVQPWKLLLWWFLFHVATGTFVQPPEIQTSVLTHFLLNVFILFCF